MCGAECRRKTAAAKRRNRAAAARRRTREYIRRSGVSDITAAQEQELRRRTRKCKLCGIWMTAKPYQPNSKQLDHILPINQGGTHTHGNVRIICADCNLKRPKDGSDFTGQLTLWAQGPVPVSRPDMRRGSSRGACRKGLHPWVPENITIRAGKKRCLACVRAKDRTGDLRRCQCGDLFPAPGRTFLCPDCATAMGLRAAELHASGLTWEQVARETGYGSAWGAAYAARRSERQAQPVTSALATTGLLDGVRNRNA